MSGSCGWCIWITGLPGSGKSVVSKSLISLLTQKGILVQLLSSDTLREIVTPHPTYSIAERNRVYNTLVYVGKLLTQNGVNIVIDATGNLRRYRDKARKEISLFVEAYLVCPLEICIFRENNRDKTYYAPKAIYSNALAGAAPNVPGVGQPYEPPLNPEIVLDTVNISPAECAQRIFERVSRVFL